MDLLKLHTLVLINIGNILALTEAEWFADFPEHLRVHVIDSQRPTNLDNLFSGGVEGERIVVWDDGSVAALKEERKAAEALAVSGGRIVISTQLILVTSHSLSPTQILTRKTGTLKRRIGA